MDNVIGVVGLCFVALLTVLPSGQPVSAQDANKHFEEGNKKYAERDLDGAIAAYTRAIEADKNHVMAYTNRGLCKAMKKDLDGAIKDFGKVIELDAKNGLAYESRGLAKAKKRDLDGAIEDFGKSIEIDEKRTDSWFYRGLAHQGQGNPVSALKDYAKVIELKPDHVEAHHNRAMIRFELGQFKEALLDFDEVIKQRPTDINSWYDRGICKQETSDPEGAIQDFSKVIQLDSKNAGAWRRRGEANTAAGHIDDALGDYGNLMDLEPGQPQHKAARGNLYILKRDWSSAEADLQGVVKDWPDSTYMHVLIWLCQAHQNRADEAREGLESFLETFAAGSTWLEAITGFVIGKVSEEAFLDLSEEGNEDEFDRQYCEATYLAGEKRLMSGDRDGAAKLFRECAGTDTKELLEHRSAVAWLTELEKRDK